MHACILLHAMTLATQRVQSMACCMRFPKKKVTRWLPYNKFCFYYVLVYNPRSSLSLWGQRTLIRNLWATPAFLFTVMSLSSCTTLGECLLLIISKARIRDRRPDRNSGRTRNRNRNFRSGSESDRIFKIRLFVRVGSLPKMH